MRTIQEVFNKVIDKGFYITDLLGENEFASNYMCFALSNAAVEGEITLEESEFACNQVKDYLIDFAFLRSALKLNELDSEGSARLAVYTDWANRPNLKTYHEILNTGV